MLLTAILAFIQSAHAEGAAAAPTGTGASTIMQMLLPLAFFAIFYFIIIRPQSRRNKDALLSKTAIQIPFDTTM